MARIRTIKPEFWTDGDVMDLSPFARLLFIGSWNFALCDFGHVADDPRRLKMQVLPADEVDGVALVEELVNAGRMVRIQVDGRSFLHIKRFTDHQKTEKRWTPRCPVCATSEPRQTSPNLSETRRTSAPERKGEERKGKERDTAPRKRPATRLRADWTPTEAHQERALAGVDIQREADSFRAHAEANDRRCVNWNAAFTQWLIKARPTTQPHKGRAAQWMDLTREMAAEQQQAPRQIGRTS
jgi:hypothetical protein